MARIKQVDRRYLYEDVEGFQEDTQQVAYFVGNRPFGCTIEADHADCFERFIGNQLYEMAATSYSLETMLRMYSRWREQAFRCRFCDSWMNRREDRGHTDCCSTDCQSCLNAKTLEGAS
ncbi:MAG: hypothetical protein AAF497_21685 [Planctomycetota bacterium]